MINNDNCLDIRKALKDKEEPVVVTEDDSVTTKSLTIFDFINDIRKYKNGNLLTENTKHIWNSYMIVQGLSMKQDDVLLCNLVNKYIGVLTPSQMYQLLLHIVEKDFSFYPWIKNKQTEKHKYIEDVVKYFECSETEAIEYIVMMGESWAKEISEKTGFKKGRRKS
jgi:hypothetical protein